MIELPVDLVLPEVLSALERDTSVVVEAPTGAGKTTRVPPALLDAGLGPVIVLEPRRLAARAAARFMARERGCEVGGEIGYQVRFDRKTSRATRLTVVTEGVLLRRLQEDPFLEGVGTVVIDEFHERSLEADLALALVRQVQSEARDDLRLVVMSATLDGQGVAARLGGCPVVRSEGRTYPVEIEHLDPTRDSRADLRRGVRAALADTEGNVLVFFPGVGEIRRAASDLSDLKSVELVELYGDLPPEKQDRALSGGERRRVVLATNVAETSVTIEGISAVVDTGTARVLRHDPSVGIDRLGLEPIAVDSADQRAGRAGRLGPGRAYRLWSGHEHRSRPPRTEPAVRRVDLSGALLQLTSFGEQDPVAFPWFEAPPPASLRRGTELLEFLGALEAGRLTELGRELARLPVAPRLGRLLVAGKERGVLDRAALVAAMLSDRDPFERIDRREPRARVSDSDVLDRVEALEEFARTGRPDAGARNLRSGAARFTLRAAQQFERMLKGGGAAQDRDAALGHALLDAFGDRLCRRREPGSDKAQMASGRGVELGVDSCVTEAELFLAMELQDTGREARVLQASAVPREWLGEPRELTRAVFDAERKRVVGRRELRLGELVLESHDQGDVDPAEAERLLASAAREDLEAALGLDREDLASFLLRWSWLREHRPELPEPNPAALLPMLVAGKTSFGQLRKSPVLAALQGTLDSAHLRMIEGDAPERVTVPTGSNIRLEYEIGRPPVLAVRIQELFGLADTPRVGGVRVLLHLLAPNGRPQQVTNDLASFWANTYVQVRKDLRGRYPKHSWPEDPLTAEPTRRTKRRPR